MSGSAATTRGRGFQATATGGVSGIKVNGGTTILQGIVNLVSPMLSLSGQDVRIDNANFTELTSAASITGPNAATFNGANLELTHNATMGAPSGSFVNGEKFTFVIVQGAAGPYTLAWNATYRFANAASTKGIKLADFNTLLAACPVNSMIRIGFEYTDFSGEDSWDAVALAGYF